MRTLYESDGYLLLCRNYREVEIWRRASDIAEMKTPRTSPLTEPSPLAATPALLAQAPFAVDSEDRPSNLRGFYLPHGLLSSPVLPYRIIRPKASLLAAIPAETPHIVHLYDMSQGYLLRSFDLDAIVRANSQGIQVHRFALFDIDLSPDHLCACFNGAVVIVPLHAADLASSSAAVSKTVKAPALVFVDNQSPQESHKEAFTIRKDLLSDRTGTEGCVMSPTAGELSYVKVAGVDALESIAPPEHESVETDHLAMIPHGQLNPYDGGFISGTIYCTAFIKASYIELCFH